MVQGVMPRTIPGDPGGGNEMSRIQNGMVDGIQHFWTACMLPGNGSWPCIGYNKTHTHERIQCSTCFKEGLFAGHASEPSCVTAASEMYNRALELFSLRLGEQDQLVSDLGHRLHELREYTNSAGL
eukprot:1141738-Pelagomonas_calceolata.AAC.2